MTDPFVIDCAGLSKHYGPVPALADLNLQVPTGSTTMFSDVWRPGLIAGGVAMGLALCEMMLGGAVPFGLFQVARAESYFREARVPWPGLLFATGLAVALVHRAIVTVERQDF